MKKILLYLLAFYAFIGFIVIPLVLKPQIIDIVAKQTNAKISIGSIYFNPLIAKLSIDEVKLSSLDDKELVSFKSLSVNLEIYSLLKPAVHVSELILQEPKISLVLDKDKKINLSSILKTTKETTTEDENSSSTEIPRIILDTISIVDGSLNYEDYSQKSDFDFKVDTIGFTLNDIDTKNIESDNAKLRFYMKLADGGFIDFKSQILNYEPFTAKGSLDFEASKLYTQWRYIKDSLNLEVADGKLTFHTNFFFNIDDLNATMISDLDISLDKLRVKPKGNFADVLTLNSLSIEDAVVKPMAQDIYLKKISLDSLYVKASRDKAGDIDWLEYIKITPNIEETENDVEKVVVEAPLPWVVVVEDVALEKIKINFYDNGISPKVDTKLNELNIYAHNITLDGKKPLKYEMSLLLNDKLKCNSQGSVIHNVLDVTTRTKCNDFDVTHYLPYIDEIAKSQLKVYDLKLRSLVAGFDANVSIKDVDSEIVVDVNSTNIELDNFAINQKSTNKRVATFNDFDISGITLNTKTKEIAIRYIVMNSLNLRVKRLEDLSLSLQNIAVPKDTKTSPHAMNTNTKEKDYRIRLKKVALKGAKVSFTDKTINPHAMQEIDRIYLSAYNIDSKKYSWLSYYLSARVNKQGKIKAKGNVRHTPLKQKGSLDVTKLSLKEITPYLQEHAYITLDDGYLSLKTKLNYAVSKKKPDLSVDGSFKLEEFFLSDSRDKSSLISFNEVNLKKFDFEMFPNRMFVEEIDVDSFYIRAIIDANKSMNLASLAKVKLENNESVVSEDENVTIVEETTASEPFPVKIMKVNVSNGSAVFSDKSLVIPFYTNIHSLHGVISTISTNPNETTYVDIVGDVDKYGSTKLKGSVNSSNPKAFTDLDFNFRNLDLSAMSGYSGSFAGHEIANGKLYLNLNYDIVESVLASENSIMIKKIKLGDEVKTADGSSALPLGFVIALLEDSDGLIDIDMPIRGNVDEPDFKYGALVWKTFGGLILKAVSSPFKFLGSMMGIDGDSLEFAEFEAGSINILPSEREKLDNVAKLLIKRPKISLNVSGGYNSVLDKAAIQKDKLVELVIQKSGAKNEIEKKNAMTIDLLEDIYEDVKDDDRLDEIKDELEEKIKDDDEFDRAYLQALIRECSDIQVVSLEDMYEVATKRSSILKKYLVDSKGIDTSRIVESKAQETPKGENKLVKTKLDVIVK